MKRFLMGGAIAVMSLLTIAAAGPNRRVRECKMVETEYRDDISITTCDGVASISVRFMSLGPGGCAVEAREDRTVKRGRVGLMALPGVWSGWAVIQNHLGVYRTKISNDVKCDTGVRSQVRYWADR